MQVFTVFHFVWSLGLDQAGQANKQIDLGLSRLLHSIGARPDLP